MTAQPCPAVHDGRPAPVWCTSEGDPPMISLPGVGTGVPDNRLRVLVADDAEINADSLSDVLRMLGHEVLTVYDGRAAIVAANDYRPDACVLIWRCPGSMATKRVARSSSRREDAASRWWRSPAGVDTRTARGHSPRASRTYFSSRRELPSSSVPSSAHCRGITTIRLRPTERAAPVDAPAAARHRSHVRIKGRTQCALDTVNALRPASSRICSSTRICSETASLSARKSYPDCSDPSMASSMCQRACRP